MKGSSASSKELWKVGECADQYSSETNKFQVVAHAHIDSVYRFALYMAGDESDAQNLVQNTYLKAYKSFDRFEEGTNCKAWLLAILNNTFMNTIHRDRIHLQAVHPPEIEECGSEPADNADPQNEIPTAPLHNDVAAAISELPIRYRAVVLLADMEGLSYKEIANIVGCPARTVMSRLCEGRKLLRRKLRENGVKRCELKTLRRLL
jgi:RNA polymerase sigma-70 factor (ECF subfamily)